LRDLTDTLRDLTGTLRDLTDTLRDLTDILRDLTDTCGSALHCKLFEFKQPSGCSVVQTRPKNEKYTLDLLGSSKNDW